MINATVNGIEVKYAIVEHGQKISEVRKANGIDLSASNVSLFKIGGFNADYEDGDDFAWSQKETHAALVAAGVDFSKVSAVIEVR